MQNKRMILFLITMVFFLTISPALAAQPEIIWLEVPAADQQITNYSEAPYYAPACYGEGRYAVNVEEGERIYTALSPDGAGTFLTGYVNQQGEWVILPAYMWAAPFSRGIAMIGNLGNGSTHAIDMTGKTITALDELKQQGYSMLQMQDGYIQLSHDSCYGIADTAGKIILPTVFLEAHLPQEGLCLTQGEKGYGFWDTTGQAVILPQYEDAQDFSEGLAAVQQDGKWGFIDKTGQMIIAPTYEEAQSFHEGLAAVKFNGLWGFLNTSGELVIPAQYDTVQNFSEGVAPVEQNDTWGCIDKKGELILACKYEEVRPCSDNRIAVKWQNRYGYFDKNGEKVIDFLYGGVKNFHEGLAVVSSGNFAGVEDDKYWFVGAGLTTSYKNNQFGVIDRWGNEVLPEEYLCISDFEDETAICQRNRDKKVGIIQAPVVQETDPGKRGFIRLYLNDELLSTDQSPVLKNGRTMVPLRTIAEALNADVRWDKTAKAALITTDEITMQLPTDSTAATVNGEQVLLDTSAQIINGRTMVPLRFVAEQFALQVQWKADSYSVQLRSKGQRAAI